MHFCYSYKCIYILNYHLCCVDVCVYLLYQESEDVMVLAMGVLVVAAILPLVPTYIASHLELLFSIFCDLATIRATNRLGKPHEHTHIHIHTYTTTELWMLLCIK